MLACWSALDLTEEFIVQRAHTSTEIGVQRADAATKIAGSYQWQTPDPAHTGSGEARRAEATYMTVERALRSLNPPAS